MQGHDRQSEGMVESGEAKKDDGEAQNHVERVNARIYKARWDIQITFA